MVTVTADDGNGGTDTIAVTINVADVNEKPTFDEPDPAARNVSENTSAGQDIGTAVSATDPEVGDTLTYTLGGTDVASFDIVSTTGQLQTKSALNKEADDTYAVTVSVRDSKNDAGTTDNADDATIMVNITVTDANDAPQFSVGSVTRSVRENTSVVEDLGGPVTATDGDNDTLTYSLDTAGATSFDIDSTSGQIKTKADETYDHETTPSYSVTVTADDNNGGTATKEVTIDVTDVNEPPLKPGTPTVSRTSNTAVSVTWTAPDNAGRPPILHYHIPIQEKCGAGLGSGEVFYYQRPHRSASPSAHWTPARLMTSKSGRSTLRGQARGPTRARAAPTARLNSPAQRRRGRWPRTPRGLRA